MIERESAEYSGANGWGRRVSLFRAYPDLDAAVKDYAEKIGEPRYRLCRENQDCVWGYFAGLLAGGWATDPGYYGKLARIAIKLGSSVLGGTWKETLVQSLEAAIQRRSVSNAQGAETAELLGVPQPRPTGPVPPSPAKPLRMMIDPGHGGADPGAIGPGGTRESDVNLLVARGLLCKLNRGGNQILMTRDRDVTVSLEERCGRANAAGVDLFLSIHCNAATNRQARGFEAYTSPGQNRSDELATCLVETWRESFPGTPVRADLSDGDPDREARFRVLMGTKCPAVLVELDFISHPNEERNLADPQHQQRMAGALAVGIRRYVGRG